MRSSTCTCIYTYLSLYSVKTLYLYMYIYFYMYLNVHFIKTVIVQVLEVLLSTSTCTDKRA